MSEKGSVIKRLQCRGAEADQSPAPLDSSSERDFLAERLGMYFLATFVASAVFCEGQTKPSHIAIITYRSYDFR